ncbi:hypothetical protein DL767_010423 [Monosporascus sp. MG133]|nr:hypothetical protein DL767_010423 [Monosporascus sp. MG133]
MHAMEDIRNAAAIVASIATRIRQLDPEHMSHHHQRIPSSPIHQDTAPPQAPPSSSSSSKQHANLPYRIASVSRYTARRPKMAGRAGSDGVIDDVTDFIGRVAREVGADATALAHFMSATEIQELAREFFAETMTTTTTGGGKDGHRGRDGNRCTAEKPGYAADDLFWNLQYIGQGDLSESRWTRAKAGKVGWELSDHLTRFILLSEKARLRAGGSRWQTRDLSFESKVNFYLPSLIVFNAILTGAVALALGRLAAAAPATDVVQAADVKAADTTTTINAKSNWGTWEGWGTSLCWWAKAFGNRDDLADIFFTLGSRQFAGQNLPGLGFNIARHNAGASSWNTYNGAKMVVSPNIKNSRQMEGHWLNWGSTDPSSSSWDWSVDVNQRAMLNKAKARGANRLELFSNSPMWWMCKNHNPSGDSNGGENIQSWNLKDHAVYMAAVAKYAKDNWGITFESVSPFNEPIATWWKANGTQEGSHITVATQATIINELRTELNNRGLSSMMIAASDESYYDQAVSTMEGLGSTALSKVGRINVHGYQYGNGRRDRVYDLSQGNGKKLWQSEYGESDATGGRLASNLFLDFRWLKPTAFVYWQVIDGGGWGLIDGNNDNGSLGSPTQKYYVLAQFSRHIREGMRILDGGSGSTIAAYDAKNRKLVIAYYNSGNAQTVNFDLSQFSQRPADGTKVARWRTSIGNGGDRYVQDTGATISGTRLTSQFATNSVQTFEIGNVSLLPGWVTMFAMGYSSDRDDHTASDHEEFYESGESDESGSETVCDLLDLEAFESGDEYDDDGMSTESHDGYHVFFPQFCRLPIELRQRVWELFDPDLRAPVRIFVVQSLGSKLWPSATLFQQTEPARTILEVHRESRQLALKFYPDKLPIMNRHSSLRYHKARDIIALSFIPQVLEWGSGSWGAIADDLKDVERLAFEIDPDSIGLHRFQLLPFHHFKSLKTVYTCWDGEQLQSRNLRWCVSDSVRTFHLKTEEEDIDLGEDYEMIYCWPDLENHLEYAEKEVPEGLRLGRFADKGEGSGIEICPMVVFQSFYGIQRYHDLRERALAGENAKWDSDSESDSDPSEEDEYESEGIDDATLDGSDGADDDDDGLVVHDTFEESDDENDTEISGFSRQSDGVVPVDDGAVPVDDDELAARFSSLEPNSPRDRNPDHSDSDDQPVRKNTRTKRRFVSSDSEDEVADGDELARPFSILEPNLPRDRNPDHSDSDDQPIRKNNRMRRRVVSSDSEDESADEPPRKVAKRSRHDSRRSGRAVLSDSDEEDTDTKSGDRGSSDSDASPSEDSEEESDREQGNREPISLAERLRLYRSCIPVRRESTESDSDETSTQNSYEEAEDDDGLVERGAYRDRDEISENDLVMDRTEEGSADDDDGW